jgi:hypothetical protein
MYAFLTLYSLQRPGTGLLLTVQDPRVKISLLELLFVGYIITTALLAGSVTEVFCILRPEAFWPVG